MLIYLGLRNEDADKAAQKNETERKADAAVAAREDVAEAPVSSPTKSTPAPARKTSGKRAKTRPA
jgi:preprotein translocase subunit SecF